MRVDEYADVDAFERAVLPFLLEREAENNLLLGLVSALRGGEFAAHPPYLAAAVADGQVAGVVLRTPPHRLIFSATRHADDIATAFASRLDVNAVPGIFGPPEVTARFAAAWRERTGRAFVISQRQRIYALHEVVQSAQIDGGLRLATSAHRTLVSEWLAGFYADTGEAPPSRSVEAAADLWVAPDDARRLYLWESGGQLVSMAGVSGSTPNGIRIGAVFTPPRLRRHGFASACVAAVSQQMLDEGRRFCFLFTDLSNPTSNHIYQEIGYRPVADCNAWEAPPAEPS